MFMSSTLKDFDKLADEVVNSFLSDSVPLETSIIKVAGREELNPEEVKRLVEKANTNTAIKLIKISTEGSMEFGLADYSAILKETHSESTPSITEPIATPSTEKVAMINTIDEDIFSIVFPKKPAEKIASDTPNLKEVFKTKMALEVLGRQKVAAELRFRKSADALLSEFSNLYSPDFNKFACEAFTLYGNTALPILDSIAENIREPKEFTKVAYVINDVTDKAMNLFKVAYDSLTEICQCIDSIDVGRADVERAWGAIRSGYGNN